MPLIRAKSWSLAALVLPGLALVLVSMLCGSRQAPVNSADGAPYVYPGREWHRLAPAEAGIDEAGLEAFVEHVGGHGCIVRHGYLVQTWGRHDAPADVASAVKPFYTHLVLAAHEAGRISSLDDPVTTFRPELADLNSDLGNPDRDITWRHLVTQTSCYGVEERPGEAFHYSDLQIALLADLLVNDVYGSSLGDIDPNVLTPLVTDALGFEDNPTMSHHRSLPGRLRISVQDFARFGLLYLSQGHWDGRQILSPETVALATSSPLPESLPSSEGVPAEMLPGQWSVGTRAHDARHLNSYSYCWWINGVMDDGRRVLSSAPEDTYGAFGHGGRHALIVMPSHDLVVVWTDGIRDNPHRHFCFGGYGAVDQALGKLMGSLEEQPARSVGSPTSAPEASVLCTAAACNVPSPGRCSPTCKQAATRAG